MVFLSCECEVKLNVVFMCGTSMYLRLLNIIYVIHCIFPFYLLLILLQPPAGHEFYELYVRSMKC